MVVLFFIQVFAFVNYEFDVMCVDTFLFPPQHLDRTKKAKLWCKFKFTWIHNPQSPMIILRLFIHNNICIDYRFDDGDDDGSESRKRLYEIVNCVFLSIFRIKCDNNQQQQQQKHHHHQQCNDKNCLVKSMQHLILCITFLHIIRSLCTNVALQSQVSNYEYDSTDCFRLEIYLN